MPSTPSRPRRRADEPTRRRDLLPHATMRPAARIACILVESRAGRQDAERADAWRDAASRAGADCVMIGAVDEPETAEQMSVAAGRHDVLLIHREDGAGPRTPDIGHVTRAIESRCRNGAVALDGPPPAGAADARAAGLPVLSVIVPVHDGGDAFRVALQRLEASALARSDWELIVIDDGGEADDWRTALDAADVVLRLPGGARGPAFARNRGAEVARAPYLLFLDADVLVHPETLGRVVEALEADPGVTAVTGLYSTDVPVDTLAARYRTLLDHYQLELGAGDVDTFFGACGAVRRGAFLSAGMYDEWRFQRPQVEDIEFGHRLRDAGGRIVLDPSLQVEHAHRWTVTSLLADEFVHRTIPGARVLGPRWSVFRSPTLTGAKRQYGVTWMTAMAAAFMLAQFVLGGWWWTGAVAAVSLIVARELPVLAAFHRMAGVGFLLQAAPLHVLVTLSNGLAYTIGRGMAALVGEPRPHPLVEAWAEVGLEAWPPMPRQAKPISVPGE